MFSHTGSFLDTLLPRDSLKLCSLGELKKEPAPGGKKSGTTILAFHYKDGVVIAGDRRMTDWHTHTDDAVKVEETENLAAIGCAGTVAFIQELKEMHAVLTTRLQNMIEMPLFIDGQAQLLKKILRANFEAFGERIYFAGYAVPVLAGYHLPLQEGMIFGFDEIGGIYEKKDYTTTGSGGRLAGSVLEDHWCAGMNEVAAVELAIHALTRAALDNYSSPPTLAPSTVLSISKAGVRYLDSKKALAMAHSLHLKDLKRMGKKEELAFFSGEEV